MIVIDTTGNLLCLNVLNESSTRNNPCSIYLWWSSPFSIVFICYNMNWSNQNQHLCKVRLFLRMRLVLLLLNLPIGVQRLYPLKIEFIQLSFSFVPLHIQLHSTYYSECNHQLNNQILT
ncbi:unnamed protein product [Rotaria socialis]